MNNLYQKFFCFVVLFFVLTGAEAKQPPAMATGGSSLNVIFLVDNTASMQQNGKYLAVRDALTKLVTNPSLASMANFGLLTWGIDTCKWGSPVDCGTITTQVPVSKSTQTCRQQPIYQYQKVCNGTKCTYQRVLVGYQNVCTSQTSTTYVTKTIPHYQWVPLSTNKQQNYIDMMNAIPNINATDMGTNIYPAMNFIKSYLGSADFGTQFNVCGTTIVIILTDGEWITSPTPAANEAYAIAKNLYNQSPSIKTFAVAFGADPTGPTFTNMAQAGGTGTGLGGFAVDANLLANTFMAAIQSVMLDTYTAVAPTILPSTTAGDLILAPEFKYSPNTQWQGFLQATKLNADGSIGSPLWELGQNLSAVSPDARHIWTAIPGVPGPTKSSTATPNNLLYSNATTMTAVTTAMETTGLLSATTPLNDATNLVKFVRGYDVFDEDANPSTLYRWKLNDIYNSKPTFVGQPSQVPSIDATFAGGFSYFYNKDPSAYDAFKLKTRSPMVYAGSNGGLLHAVDATSGQEKWAFLPPPLMNKIKDVMTSVLNTTNSIYGVDGAVVAQDVYVNNEWRTYLAVGMGLGARAYSILDITNPDLPMHVVSIENAIDASGTRTIKKWASDGSLTTITGYETLGYTKSAPVFSYTKDGTTYEPVLIIGAGVSNSGISAGVGSSVFVVSLKPGSEGNIVAMKDVSSAQNPSSSVLTLNTSAATASATNKIYLSSTYAIDIGSGVSGSGIASNTVVQSVDSGMQVTLSQNVTSSIPVGTPLTFTRRIFNEVEAPVELLLSGSTQPMSGQYGYKMLVPNNDGMINSFDESGTTIGSLTNSSSASNVMDSLTTFANDRLINQEISVSSATANPSANLNIIYGTGDMDMLSLTDKSPQNLVVSIQDAEANIFGKNVTRSFSQFLDATNSTANICPSSSQQGWYANINGLTAWDANGKALSCTSGKVSSKIETYGGLATVPLYIPPLPSSANYCTGGDSAVVFLDAKCGYQAVKGIYLNRMTVGGVAAYKDKIYISVSSQSGSYSVDATGNFQKVNNVIFGTPNFSLTSGTRMSVKSKVRVH